MKTLILSFLLSVAAVVASAQLPHPATLAPSSSAQSAAVWNAQGNALAAAAVGGVYFPGNNGTQGSIRTTLYNGTTLSAIGTNAFTLWLRFRETATEGACAFTVLEPSGSQGWIVLNMSSGRPFIEKGLAGSAQPNMVFDNLKGRLAGSMVDFVMVRSAGTITYYWNGVATTATAGTDNAGTLNLTSGASFWLGGGFSAAANFDSLVNRAAVFNRALSATEVLSLGTYGIARTDQWGTTASPGCILDLDLTKGSGTTVTDRSGNLTPTTTGSFTHQLPRTAASGTVANVSVTSTNGVSATVANPTNTPALSFTLGDITPTTVYLRGTDAVSNAMQMVYISETLPRFAVRKDGVIVFGSGSAATDTDLYRNGVGLLKTSTKFEASSLRAVGSGGLTVGSAYASSTPGAGGALIEGELKAGTLRSIALGLTVGGSYASTAAPASGAIIEGYVGAGTSTPRLPFHVVGGSQGWPASSGTNQSNGTLRLQQVGAGFALDFGGNAGSGGWVQAVNAGNLATSYPLMLNPNGGKVRVGSTTAPSADLDVTGTGGFSGGITVGSSGLAFSNLRHGIATLASGTKTVTDTNTTALTRYICTPNSGGGTVGFPSVTARSVGASFTITSSSGSDTNNVAYWAWEP